MKESPPWRNRFKELFTNNKLVLALLVLLLISLNIMLLDKISYVFHPLAVLLKTVLLPFILTGVAFYFLNPVVDYFEARRVPRGYTILALYLLIGGAIALVVVAVVPLISQQISSLVDNFPTYSAQAQLRFEELMGSQFISQLQGAFDLDTKKLTDDLGARATDILNRTWNSLGSFVGAVTETVLAIITVPFILFYLLRDRKRLSPFVLGMLPDKLRNRSYRVMLDMNRQISSYIRGQIIVSFCIGALLYVGYLVIGLDYSLTLAIVAACTSIVPYLGPAIAITPALIVALVTSPIMLLKMIVVWTIVQLVEGKFISPQIMGKTMRIHPITIIFVILTSGHLFGIIGILLAVPGYAVLKVVVVHLFDWYKGWSDLYSTETEPPNPAAPPSQAPPSAPGP